MTLHIGTNDGKAWKVDAGHVSVVDQDSPGLDGSAARALAGLDEICTILFSKRNERPKRYYPGGPASRINVISTTEMDADFSFKSPAGLPLRVPSEFQAEGIVCVRNDIVPSPNDYRVVLGGYNLSIADSGTGHPDRMGRLELVDGQFRYRLINGEPLTEELSARVTKRLQGFQQHLPSGNPGAQPQ